jgi:hypothetical protein
MIKLIDLDKFQKVLSAIMNNSKSRDERIVFQYQMLYVFKIIRLIFIAILITYFIGCGWFYFCTLFEDIQHNNFIKQYELKKEGIRVQHQIVISCYYALTTLSTVGYGDYYPICNQERILGIIIMLFGVAFFAFVMGNFIEIISNYEEKMGGIDQSPMLNNWLHILTRFNNN